MGTPSRRANSRASSGPTPRGSPPAASFWAMTMLPKLTPARSVPEGANSERSDGETVGVMAQEVTRRVDRTKRARVMCAFSLRTLPRSMSRREVMSEPVKYVRDYRAWLGIVVLLIASAVFSLIAATVARHDPILQRDLQVLVWLHTHGSPAFTDFLLAITYLHSMIGISVFPVILGATLAQRHKWHWVLALGLSAGGGMPLNTVLRLVSHRKRPGG